MIDLYTDSSWIKINRIVREKYGKSLTYRGLKLISDEGKEITKNSFYSVGDDLVIPLKSKNCDLGDIIVGRGSLLEIQQKIEISDLIKFLVEPKLYNLQLRKSEANLKNNLQKGLHVVVESKPILNLFKSSKQRKETLSNVLLLKAHLEFTRHRVAMKIHEMTERNLFVHLEDILSSLVSINDLQSLQDATIYIRDIEQVSQPVMDLISKFIELNNSNGPVFLFGSSLTADKIQNRLDWSESFKKDLCAFLFDIDRVPMSQQISEEVLELLFFQLETMQS